MMIGADLYISQLEGASYFDLIKERDKLIQFMHKYEKDEMAGDRSDPAWRVCPMPNVKYQKYFDYLATLCRVMRKKYNKEYAWPGLMLKVDIDCTREEEMRRRETELSEIEIEMDQQSLLHEKDTIENTFPDEKM